MFRAIQRLFTFKALTGPVAAGALTALFITGCAQIENTVYDIRGLPPGKVSVVVDLTGQEAYLYAGGQLALKAPISTGREGTTRHLVDTKSSRRMSIIDQASMANTLRTGS